MAKNLRGGFTTGACLAAGARAGAAFWQGRRLAVVPVVALDGTLLDIPVHSIEQAGSNKVQVEIIKDAGDDPDITNGTSIFVTFEPGGGEKLSPEELKRTVFIDNICLVAGEGIGTVTKPGLSVAVGEPAINPGPRKLLQQELEKELGQSSCIVRIDIPAGAELAHKTLNPILGVEGGISVIGTTGVLRPMSEEAFKDSLVPQIDVAMAAGYKTLVYCPGKIGERIASSWGLPEEAMVQTSNFIGHMLEAGADRGLESILLFGHIGKLAKVAAGVFHTHNRVGDGRLEVLAAYSGALGMPAAGIKRILEANTTEDALPVISEYRLEKVYDVIAARASCRAERFLFGKVKVGTVLVTLKGELLGMDDRAREIGGDFNWNIK
ncbi:MAG: cobalt-precorrin-5B (C(1))-methyltransferase CbiD [Anaerovibrio sp.]|nr:cobalt-precorrin-5B (C(1))-methyltransferase CbiD [Selenomonadaceae bacterium]MDY6053245.1 cobalt-precorrin-5B (C(1))-methyltransferase CbiD [Anaerovibrio sp.]